MIRGSTIKALFVGEVIGEVSNRTEVTEHVYAHPYRDATMVNTPIHGRGYTHVYVAEYAPVTSYEIDNDRTQSYCIYHPEIVEEFPDGYPEWAHTIAHRAGVHLDMEKGVYSPYVGVEGLGREIWDVAAATARIYIRLDEIKEESGQ